jgi:eukaryotic-like serine/threonine-protein kinase
MELLDRVRNALADRYEIEREIGRGGMATVFLARDVRHSRRVALKLLEPELGAVLGSERFLAEIRVTANLQHPNLLPLFDSGDADGLLFYVMPYVEGESLRARLDREKQLPVDEAIRMATAMAEALDYAHRHGIIHRDLKPENVLLHEGQPLIADFGIALAVSNAGGSRITQTGISLGTPQYMSPEQATGDRTIDGRTDIYSLGVMLYEMLTGDPPYTGSTSQAVIARVLTERPRSVRASRHAVPEHVDAAIERALEKLPADRFASAHVFAAALVDASPVRVPRTTAAAVKPEPRWRAVVPWAIATAAVIAAIVLPSKGQEAGVGSVVVSTLMPPPGYDFSEAESFGALSPNGKFFAFVTLGPKGATQLWIRRLDTLSARRVSGTEGAVAPFWSPDGKSIGYFARGTFFTTDIGADASRAVCPVRNAYSGSWGKGNVVAIANDEGILRATVDGAGECKLVIRRDTAGTGPRHVWLLPDARHVLHTNHRTMFSLDVGDLESGDTKRVMDQVQDAKYVEPGILLFGRSGIEGQSRVWARRFDANTLTFSGDAVAVTEAVRMMNGVFAFAVSQGSASQLTYLPGAGDNGEVITNRDGVMLDTAAIVGAWMHNWARNHPWLATTGDAAVVRYDTERHLTTQLITIQDVTGAQWSPGDSLIAVGGCPQRTRCGITIRSLATNRDTAIVSAPKGTTHWPSSWSTDGRHLLYSTTAGFSLRQTKMWAYDFRERKAIPLVDGDSGVFEGSLSPDGRWLAYRAWAADRWDVFVRPFLAEGSAIQVSPGGGRSPRWRSDGRELFYQSPDGFVMSSTVTPGAQFTFTPPRNLLMAAGWTRHNFYDIGTSYDVSPDGQRFAFRMSATGTAATGTAAVLVQNWRSLLK